MNKLNKNVKIIIGIIIVLIIILSTIIYKIVNNNSYESLENLEIENIEETEENNIKEQNTIESEETKEIAIHITGEVKKKGLIYLKKGSRVADAIEKAGGETKNANLDNINLAYVLEDGQKIYIPNKNEKNETKEYISKNSGNNVIEGVNKNQESLEGENEKVNINTASQTELETLPGIGPSLAERIMEYRENNGQFKKVEDVQNVKGIGNAKYSNIKEKICI